MASSVSCDVLSASKLRRLRAAATKQRLHAATENHKGIQTIQSQLAILTSTVDGLCFYVSCFLANSGSNGFGYRDGNGGAPYTDVSEFSGTQVSGPLESYGTGGASCNAATAVGSAHRQEDCNSELSVHEECISACEVSNAETKQLRPISTQKATGEAKQVMPSRQDPWLFLDRVELGRLGAVSSGLLELVGTWTPLLEYSANAGATSCQPRGEDEDGHDMSDESEGPDCEELEALYGRALAEAPGEAETRFQELLHTRGKT